MASFSKDGHKLRSDIMELRGWAGCGNQTDGHGFAQSMHLKG